MAEPGPGNLPLASGDVIHRQEKDAGKRFEIGRFSTILNLCEQPTQTPFLRFFGGLRQ